MKLALLIVLFCFFFIMPLGTESNELACVCNRSFTTLGALKGHRNRCFKWKTHKKTLTQPDLQAGPTQIPPDSAPHQTEGFVGPASPHLPDVAAVDQRIVEPNSAAVQVRKIRC